MASPGALSGLAIHAQFAQRVDKHARFDIHGMHLHGPFGHLTALARHALHVVKLRGNAQRAHGGFRFGRPAHLLAGRRCRPQNSRAVA